MTLRHIVPAIGMVALVAAPAVGQATKVKTETKVEVKDGKDVTLTGCVERSSNENGAEQYRLTNVADKTSERHSYILVGKEGELAQHVGQMIEVKGKAADRSDGEVKVQTKTKVEREDAPDLKKEGETKVKGDLIELPLLGVKDLKMIRPTCS
jgi:hypothetical protein